MNPKKLGKALLFPHISIMILLVPVATVLLVGSMVFVGTESVIAIISYVLAAYTLTVWCFKIPYLIKYFKTFKDENKYARRWQDDTRLRVNVSLYGALAWNALYGLFQLWLGFCHHTFWFCSLGAYYICLGVMRFFLLLHTRKYAPGEKMQTELVKYRACGCVFLLMNLALALIIFFMVYFNRSFEHHMITAIAMAAYTFAAFTAALVRLVGRKKDKTPILSAVGMVDLAGASASMLMLTSTMLTAFAGDTPDPSAQRIFVGTVGLCVSSAVILMAVYMIVKGTGELKRLQG